MADAYVAGQEARDLIAIAEELCKDTAMLMETCTGESLLSCAEYLYRADEILTEYLSEDDILALLERWQDAHYRVAALQHDLTLLYQQPKARDSVLRMLAGGDEGTTGEPTLWVAQASSWESALADVVVRTLAVPDISCPHGWVMLSVPKGAVVGLGNMLTSCKPFLAAPMPPRPLLETFLGLWTPQEPAAPLSDPTAAFTAAAALLGEPIREPI